MTITHRLSKKNTREIVSKPGTGLTFKEKVVMENRVPGAIRGTQVSALGTAAPSSELRNKRPRPFLFEEHHSVPGKPNELVDYKTTASKVLSHQRAHTVRKRSLCHNLQFEVNTYILKCRLTNRT